VSAGLPPAPGGGLRIEPIDPHSEEVARLLDAYFAEIRTAFGYRDERAAPTVPEEFVPPHGVFLIVRDEGGVARGCGAIRMLDPSTAELKRMWIHPEVRGRGAGRDLLRALEAAAVGLGADHGVLDTHSTLVPAIKLYRAAGWSEVPPYNDNAEATHWFAKDLTGAR
jgi:GNAT superfamily N-acetyltransferase